MQFSEQWLRSFVNPALDSEGLSHLLTMAGLEVEETQPLAPPFSGVVVGLIVSIAPHPNADRLRVCQVDAGLAAPLQIVCGAPNAAEGLKVPCALVGARLPGDFEIKAAKLRGVESFGMLCSARELGLADESDGLLQLASTLQPGTDVREALALNDVSFTIKLTPNRPDCLSMLGIAREVAALTGAELNEPVAAVVLPTINTQRELVLDAPNACPRYLGRVLEGVDASRPTPEWMLQRLLRSGIRSISVIVDITNYVMLELGQPLHAFDNAKLDGALHVRWAQAGDALTLLNGQALEPVADFLLIADEVKPLALAGVMGGLESGVDLATRAVFLESAFFSPEAIVGRARRLAMSSDAAHRFERGVDFELPQRAIERASALIIELCGGFAGPVVQACVPAQLPQRAPVMLRVARAEQIIGLPFATETVAALFQRLGMATEAAADVLQVRPPSYRFDIQIEEDLIEEVARVYGYDNIPEALPSGFLAMLPQPERRKTSALLRHQLAARDFQEVVNYAFVDARWERDFCANAAPIVLSNPIASHLSAMRSSLVGGLIGTLAANQRRRAGRVRIFEIGRCFQRQSDGEPVPGYHQPLKLAALAWGPALPEQWGLTSRRVDFYDLKGELEALFVDAKLHFTVTTHPALHPGRAAAVAVNGEACGWIGELHPSWVQQYELLNAPVVFELDLDVVLARALPQFESPSRFPAVQRDLALVLRHEVPAGQILACLQAASSEIVQAIDIFDVYQGLGVEPGCRSIAFRVRFQHTHRTLEDAEIEAAISALVSRASQELGAQLRS